MSSPQQPIRNLTANYALIQSISNMAYCCVVSFAAVFLLSRGFSNAEVGVTLAIAGGLTLVSQPFIASFADRTRRVSLSQIVAGFLLFSLAIGLLLLLTPSMFVLTAILYILLFCAFNCQVPLITSMAMEHVNAGTPLNFSLARGIGSFAFALLALLLGALSDQYGGWIVIVIGMLVSVVGILLVLRFPRSQRSTHTVDNPLADSLSFGAFMRQNKLFMALIGSIALLYFSHILINTYAIQIISRVGGSESDMGISSAIGGFLELPAMALFPLILKRIKNVATILKWSSFFLVLKTLVTLLAPTIGWIYVAQCLQFFAFAMFIPASVYYVNQVIYGANKVKGQTSMVLGMSISAMLGNFLGGIMLDSSGGVGFMLSVGLAVSFLGLVLVLLFIKQIDARRSATQLEAAA
jgi:PPP family 3-phenylpropionic acid transporter